MPYVFVEINNVTIQIVATFFYHSAIKRKQIFRLRKNHTPAPFKLNGCSLNTIAKHIQTLNLNGWSIMTFNHLNLATFDLNMNYYLTINTSNFYISVIQMMRD